MTEISSVPSTAPPFALPGVDGREHSLKDYGDAKALVLIQFCNHCPYAQAWEDRINQIARDYSPKDVAVVAVCSNDAESHPGDSFLEMIKRAEERDFSFAYLHDEDQSLARTLGAQRTPEVFVFDGTRNLAYHGAVDDDRDGDNITQHYLRDALDAVLGGRTPDPAETPPVGCSVKWKAP